MSFTFSVCEARGGSSSGYGGFAMRRLWRVASAGGKSNGCRGEAGNAHSCVFGKTGGISCRCAASEESERSARNRGRAPGYSSASTTGSGFYWPKRCGGWSRTVRSSACNTTTRFFSAISAPGRSSPTYSCHGFSKANC